MPEVILADSRMETMEGYYPNRKPVGNVKIDLDHPLARGLVFAEIFNGQDDLTNSRQVTGGDYPEKVADHVKFNGTGNGIEYGTEDAGLDNLSRFSVAARVHLADDSVDRVIIRKTADAFYPGWIFFWDQTDGVPGDYQFDLFVGGASSGNFERASTNANTPNNEIYSIAATFDGGRAAGSKVTISLNGRDETNSQVAGAGTSTIGGAGELLKVGKHREDDWKYWESDMYYIFLYNRVLSSGEQSELNTHPYQFLIPAG